MFHRFLLFFLLLGAHGAGAAVHNVGDEPEIPLDQLHPTQFTVGMREVDILVAEYGEWSKKGRAVIGPEGKLYLINGHHHARATWIVRTRRSKVPRMKVVIVADLSDLGERFWPEMEARNWVHLRGPAGEPRRAEDLPSHVRDLVDDPYRSLAWMVKKVGGFDDLGKPFQEFFWAEYFRSRIALDPTDLKSWSRALKRALELARDEEARQLAGYNPSLEPSKKACRKMLERLGTAS